MKALRTLLILLFSLTLPLNGYAALAAVPSPACPVSQDQDMAAMSPGESCGCHNDSGDKHAAPGKCDPSQCAQMCKTANPLPSMSVKFVPSALPLRLSLPSISPRIVSFAASGVWRPPRLL